MYRASDEVDNQEWLGRIDSAAERLDLDAEARTRATDLFLSSVPEQDRSKAAVVAAALYVGALTTGDGRSQGEVADAVGVSRLAVQQRWKDMMRDAGLEPPSW